MQRAEQWGNYGLTCVYRSADDLRFHSIPTTRDELARLLERQRPVVVLVEACLLAGWVHDLCVQRGVKCLVANTASEAWKLKHTKRKTDRDDAKRLAELYEASCFGPGAHLPPPGPRQPPSVAEEEKTWATDNTT